MALIFYQQQANNQYFCIIKQHVARTKMRPSHSKHIHLFPQEAIGAAFWLNLFFSLFTFFGGLFSNSSSLLAESIHTLGDTLSVGAAWLLEGLSKRKSDDRYTYGYRRYSLLASIIVSTLLILVALSMLFVTLNHFFHWSTLGEALHSHGEPNARGMLVVAVVGLGVKAYAAYRLKKGHSLNERSVMFHMLMDSLSWGAILLSSLLMLFINIPLLDKILTLLIALWILYHMIPHLLRAFKILLQAAPAGVNIEEIKAKIKALHGVKALATFRLWTLDGEAHVLTLRLICSPDVLQSSAAQEQLRSEIRLLATDLGIEESTIELTSSN